jgi:stage V sporulation protein B
VRIINSILDSIKNYIPTSEKFSRDIFWSSGSFFIAGVSGIGLSVITAKYYSPEILGLMNITLVIYTIYSQFTGFGIHFSVLKSVSENIQNKNRVTGIMRDAFLSTICTSIVFAALFYSVIDLFSVFFHVSGLELSLKIITPSMIFLSVNKVTLSYLNGIRSMRSFAIYNAIRYLLWLIVILLMIEVKFEGNKIALVFLMSESILFVILLPYVIKSFWKSKLKSESWFVRHIVFGAKSVFGTIFADFNSRIDVLVLSVYSDSYTVGIYSLATIVIDGLMQMAVVFRVNVNPIITDYFFNKTQEEFKIKMRNGVKFFYYLMIPIVIIIAFVYPYFISFVKLPAEYNTVYIPLLIMLSGLILSIGYQPFIMIYNQTGYPGKQTLYYSLVFFTNLVLNIILVPIYGITGAAISTSLMFLSIPFYINIIAKNTLNCRI